LIPDNTRGKRKKRIRTRRSRGIGTEETQINILVKWRKKSLVDWGPKMKAPKKRNGIYKAKRRVNRAT